jgi:hypothetical protein
VEEGGNVHRPLRPAPLDQVEQTLGALSAYAACLVYASHDLGKRAPACRRREQIWIQATSCSENDAVLESTLGVSAECRCTPNDPQLRVAAHVNLQRRGFPQR